MTKLSEQIASHGGAALIIDYGYIEAAFGDTFQALHKGAYADPYDHCGEADLTAHVNFARLADIARNNGGAISGPVTQGAFLDELGLRIRSEQIKKQASPTQRRDIDVAAHRLTAPDQMGNLFKILAITQPGQIWPIGFSR